jgi:hypothetical protein
VAAALVTLAVLAAFAAASGGVAVLRTIMRSRRASGSRPVTSAKGRTRQQLYSEAKRQNIRGRSSMNKAQLERALSHQGASR